MVVDEIHREGLYACICVYIIFQVRTLNEGVHDALVEAVRGGDHDVQARVVNWQRARFGKSIEQIEALLALLACVRSIRQNNRRVNWK